MINHSIYTIVLFLFFIFVFTILSHFSLYLYYFLLYFVGFCEFLVFHSPNLQAYYNSKKTILPVTMKYPSSLHSKYILYFLSKYIFIAMIFLLHYTSFSIQKSSLPGKQVSTILLDYSKGRHSFSL